MENYSHEIYRILSRFSFLFYATEILSLKKQEQSFLSPYFQINVPQL